jgi:hypothetical protein
VVDGEGARVTWLQSAVLACLAGAPQKSGDDLLWVSYIRLDLYQWVKKEWGIEWDAAIRTIRLSSSLSLVVVGRGQA